jgi:hypothetical protein
MEKEKKKMKNRRNLEQGRREENRMREVEKEE